MPTSEQLPNFAGSAASADPEYAAFMATQNVHSQEMGVRPEQNTGMQLSRVAFSGDIE